MKVIALIRLSPAAASKLANVAVVIPPEQAPDTFSLGDLVILRTTSLAWTRLSM